MRTLPFKTVLSGIIDDQNYTFATIPEQMKTQTTGHINQCLDMAYPWLDDGWPELRKVVTGTVTSQVISLDALGTSLYGISKVISVSKNHPWKSSLPEFRDFQITADGITVTEAVTDATLYVAHIEAPPIYNSTAWVTGTAYAVGDVRLQGDDCYRCATAHTSGTFTTDLAAGKWVVLPSIPAFLHVPVRTSVLGAMKGTDGGQPETRERLIRLMENQLSLIPSRYHHTPGQ